MLCKSCEKIGESGKTSKSRIRGRIDEQDIFPALFFILSAKNEFPFCISFCNIMMQWFEGVLWMKNSHGKKMHILEMTSGTGINGAVVNCEFTAKELKKRGHRVSLACRPGALIEKRIGPLMDDVVISRISHLKPRDLWRLIHWAKDRRVDVVHTHQSDAHSCGAIMRLVGKVPCVASAHTTFVQLHWAWNDYVIASSEHVKNFHARYNFVRRGKIGVVHNFVDVGRFTAGSTYMNCGIRKVSGFGPEGKTIGTVANLTPRKGIEDLLRAMGLIQKHGKNVRLLIGGGGDSDYILKLKKLASRLGIEQQTEWVGFVRDTPAFLPNLNIFALPSCRDSIPLSILDAMAASLPVVATDVNGVRECVHHGKTGFLVRPHDPESLAEKLLFLLTRDDLAAEMGNAGRIRVADHFSIESQIPKIEKILRQHSR